VVVGGGVVVPQDQQALLQLRAAQHQTDMGASLDLQFPLADVFPDPVEVRHHRRAAHRHLLRQFLDAVAGVVGHEGQREVIGRGSAPAPRRVLGGGAARFQETIDIGDDIGGRCHGDEATHPTILENASPRNPELVESKPSHTRAIE